MSGTLKGLRPRRPSGWWLRSLGVAIAYYAIGRLVWLLTGSPGHAAPLWPSAGIALAFVLLAQDLGLCAGAALGGFGLALRALTTAAGLRFWYASGVAGVIGVGVGLEVLAAALLVRRVARLPWGLSQTRSVVRLGLLAGPGPALVGATLGTAALFWAGLIPIEQLPREAALWWAGDGLGLVVFGPLGLVLGSRAAEMPWRRRLLVGGPVVLLTALTLSLYLRANRWDQRRGDAVVRERGAALASAVERSLIYNLDALRTVADYLGSARVEGESFRRVATGTVVRHFAFTGLAWAPAPVEGKSVPVDLVDPMAADPKLAGTDLAADPDRRARLSAARHDGELVVLDAPPEGQGLWLFAPAPGRTGEGGVSGFVGGLLRLDLLVDRALTGVDRHGLGLELREGASGRVLHRSLRTPLGRGAVALPARGRLGLGERAFAVVPVVDAAALAVERSGEAWIVLVAGMLLVALLQGVLLVVTGGDDDTEDTLVETEWPPAYQTQPPAQAQAHKGAKARSPRR
jgi:integral membrane sensor domain MASE1